MDYTDEAIILMRKQMEQNEKERHSEKVIREELKQSIYDEEVKIFHIPVKFEEMELLDGKITMRLPSDFTPRTREEIERVYFLGNGPQNVYSNAYLDFALALNWTTHRVSDGALFEAARGIQYVMERVGPKMKILGEEKLERPEGNLVIYKILANALDGVMYMDLFCVSVEERLLMGTISFDQKLSKRLAPLINEMVKSVHVIREE